MRMNRLTALTVCGLLASTAIPSAASAQLAPPAPVRQSIDGNGVDLFLGTANVRTPSLTIGQEEPQGLDYYQLNRGSGWSDNVTAALDLSGSTMTVSLGGISDRFTKSGSTYTPTEANGATLTFNGTTNVYTYTRSDGTAVSFSKNFRTNTPYYSNEGRVTQLTRPSGAKLTYSYTAMPYCYNFKPGGGGYICMQMGTAYRINTIRNSYGYQLTINYSGYEYEYDPTAPENQPDFYAWSKVAGGTLTNLAVASGASTPTISFNACRVSSTLPTRWAA